MTKEELKQEAEKKCVCTDEAMRIMYGIGYIDGAEPREKHIAELEQQIEKMKCCRNCRYFDIFYNTCKITKLTLKSCLCNALDKWELRR